MIRAVLFDVDFTLIYPGPTFRGEGYRDFCNRHGIEVDETRFAQGVISAARLLDGPNDEYDAEVFVAYARHIIEQMGGRGDRVDACAREIYAEWAACHHFHLYDEVPDALRNLAAAGLRIGLISNSHRCMTAFQAHFELNGLVDAALSAPEHGFVKPSPSIFRAVLQLLEVEPTQALMVGDSITQDVDGARKVGMQAVLVHRSPGPHPSEADLTVAGVAVIRSLSELPSVISAANHEMGGLAREKA